MPVLTDVRESIPLPVGDGEPTLPAEVLICPVSHRSIGGERPSGRAREAAPACEGTTVLVAEDHAPTVRDLVLLAEARGHSVIAVADGTRAWSVLRRRRVSLVIVGRAIPGLDGLELCRRIRARRADHYTYIVLTGEGGDCHRLEGLHAGADDFLARPLDLREMTARLVIARRILAMQEGLARKNAELARLAETDPLTGLCNRRRFDEALRMHASLANRRGLPLALAMLDVDHFKAYNDAFGHPAGDGVLRGSRGSSATRPGRTTCWPATAARSSPPSCRQPTRRPPGPSPIGSAPRSRRPTGSSAPSPPAAASRRSTPSHRTPPRSCAWPTRPSTVPSVWGGIASPPSMTRLSRRRSRRIRASDPNLLRLQALILTTRMTVARGQPWRH